jgi:hypothetical protein
MNSVLTSVPCCGNEISPTRSKGSTFVKSGFQVRRLGFPRIIEKQLIKVRPWLAGSHTDVGDGYKQHDLADISLRWMVAEVSEGLAFDLNWLANISSKPTAPYGQMSPHM